MLREEAFHPLQLTMQEVKSVANQLGKERVLCEIFGAGGWDIDICDMKRIADWVFVNGINFVNQHLVYSTITGSRKRDHPQSFDWREPWWDAYTEINDYMARCPDTFTGKDGTADSCHSSDNYGIFGPCILRRRLCGKKGKFPS